MKLDNLLVGHQNLDSVLQFCGQSTLIMIQIRIHGRGCQSVVTGAEILSMAAFADGKHAQAFPSFGLERTGAPVMAFCRIDQTPIRNREPVFTPDVLPLQDTTLLHQMDVFGGLSSQGQVLINSSRSVGELHPTEFLEGHSTINLYTLPPTEIAIKHLGRPLANAALIVGFAGISGALSQSEIEKSITQNFSGPFGEKFVDFSNEAYGNVMRAKMAKNRNRTKFVNLNRKRRYGNENPLSR